MASYGADVDYGANDFNPSKYKFDKFPPLLEPSEAQKEYMDKHQPLPEDKIVAIAKFKRNKKFDSNSHKRVIDDETGVIYKSIKDAAIENCIVYSKLFAMLRGVHKNGYSLRIMEKFEE